MTWRTRANILRPAAGRQILPAIRLSAGPGLSGSSSSPPGDRGAESLDLDSLLAQGDHIFDFPMGITAPGSGTSVHRDTDRSDTERR